MEKSPCRFGSFARSLRPSFLHRLKLCGAIQQRQQHALHIKRAGERHTDARAALQHLERQVGKRLPGALYRLRLAPQPRQPLVESCEIEVDLAHDAAFLGSVSSSRQVLMWRSNFGPGFIEMNVPLGVLKKRMGLS